MKQVYFFYKVYLPVISECKYISLFIGISSILLKLLIMFGGSTFKYMFEAILKNTFS